MKKTLLFLLSLLLTVPAHAEVRTLVIPGAIYGDNLPSGAYAALVPQNKLATHRGDLPLPALDGSQPLYLRVHEDARGVFKTAGQDHASGRTLELVLPPVLDGSQQWVRGVPACGVNPVIYDRAGTLHASDCSIGSQGYRYVADDGRLVTGDQSFHDAALRLFEYSVAGDVAVGQGEAGGCVAVRQGDRRVLSGGDCRFVRLSRAGSTLAVAMSKFAENRVVFLWLDVADLPSFPIEGRPLPPIPTPTPPAPPAPAPTPAVECGHVPAVGQALLQELARVFAEEIRSPDDEVRRRWARRAAEQLAFSVSPAWGTKRAGEGRPPSKDAVARIVDGALCSWDIVNGATRALMFGRGEVMDAAQQFIAVTPTNHLVTSPPPPSPPAPDAELVFRITTLERSLGLLTDRLATLEARIAILEATPDPAPGVDLAAVQAAIDLALSRLRVEGKTSTAWGHQHGVSLVVKRVE